MNTKIMMAHGSGGSATSELIENIFAKYLNNPILSQMEDSSVMEGAARIAMTTDSFVVKPLLFPGGDIGRLSICGTVNDLLMRGAVPKYLTCGFILEEGLSLELLEQVVASMAETAKEAGVLLVAGDTKVVEGNGGMYINTAGVGFVTAGLEISGRQISKGDAVIVSGNMGNHHAAILSARLQVTNAIKSDCAPLNQMVDNLLSHHIPVHAMRDITRGGLATVLYELAKESGRQIILEDTLLPVDSQVKDFCAMMGLDPYYMGNEGKMVVFVPQEAKGDTIRYIRESNYGTDAVCIGSVESIENKENTSTGVFVKTSIGGYRRLSVLQGEGLPRIC